MARFPRCQPVIPYLQRVPSDESVERVLESLQAEAEEYPERHRQLAAIRFYLHLMLWECERFWMRDVAKGITNYKTLLDQIERWRKPGERVCLVTFNYDTLLETALPSVGVTIRDLPDYIASEHYKVIKLHGSVHWAREVNTPNENLAVQPTWEIVRLLIQRAPDLEITARYRIAREHPIARSDQITLFPALAIPVETKREYECPPEHLDALHASILEATKVLVIGWRATELPFRRLLAERLHQDVLVMSVTGDPHSAQEVNERLREVGIGGEFLWTQSGFTDFIVRREADAFLQR
ncbi:MAG: SIR2 family protein [Nitrospinota bacterium]